VLGRVSGALHLAASAILVVLLGWTVVHIVGRAAFGAPVRGTVELTEIAVVALVYLGLARAERDDAHITVDLLFVKLGYRAQLIMRVVAGLIGAGVVAVLTWRLYLFSGQLDSGGYTTGILRIPLGPVALVGVVGATVFGLAILSNVAVSIRALIRER
jgi:TRAP-type transport system small permease protein